MNDVLARWSAKLQQRLDERFSGPGAPGPKPGGRHGTDFSFALDGLTGEQIASVLENKHMVVRPGPLAFRALAGGAVSLPVAKQWALGVAKKVSLGAEVPCSLAQRWAFDVIESGKVAA